eukprot:g7500.t1
MVACLQQIADRLSNHENGLYEHVELIKYARVPLVKCREAFSYQPIEITVNNFLGVRNSELLEQYFTCPIALNLALRVKRWAKTQNLVRDQWNGLLSSYAYTLMVVAFLQSVGLLPVLTFTEELATLSQDNVEQLLREQGRRLDQKWDWHRHGRVCREGKEGSPAPNLVRSWLSLAVEDPYEDDEARGEGARRGLTRRVTKAAFGIGFAAAFGSLYFARSWVEDLLSGGSTGSAKGFRHGVAGARGTRDESLVRLKLRTDGHLNKAPDIMLRPVIIPKPAFEELLRARNEKIKASIVGASSTAFKAEHVHAPVDATLRRLWTEGLIPRIVRFEEWAHLREQTIANLVAQDLEDYIRKQYELLVLRPDFLEPKLQNALRKEVLEPLCEALSRELERIDEEFLAEVERAKVAAEERSSGEIGAGSDSANVDRVGKNGTAASIPPAAPSTSSAKVGRNTDLAHDDVRSRQQIEATIVLDWEGQAAKVRGIPAAFEKSTGRTVGLLAAGGLLGKAVVTKAAGATTTAAIGTTAAASKVFFSKLTTPFLGKVFAATAGPGASAATLGAAAGAAGAVVGGPLGVGAGLTVDYLLHKGIALLSRKQFREDMHEMLEATREEWAFLLVGELERAVESAVAEVIAAAVLAPSGSNSDAGGLHVDGDEKQNT